MSIFTYAEDISYINDKLSAPAILGQAAEEADELGKACLKLQRILMGENPTPVTEPEARASLIEEMADICCSMEALTQKLGINFQANILPIIPQKAERWAERIHEKLADVTDINVGDKKPMPMSFKEVKALDGEKICIIGMGKNQGKGPRQVHYYSSTGLVIEVVGGSIRHWRLKVEKYGIEWVAYRVNHWESSHGKETCSQS